MLARALLLLVAYSGCFRLRAADLGAPGIEAAATGDRLATDAAPPLTAWKPVSPKREGAASWHSVSMSLLFMAVLLMPTLSLDGRVKPRLTRCGDVHSHSTIVRGQGRCCGSLAVRGSAALWLFSPRRKALILLGHSTACPALPNV